jgi:hypothetical protein
MKNEYFYRYFNRYFFAFLTTICFSAVSIFAQQNIVINNPSDEEKPLVNGAEHENLIKKSVLPKTRKYWAKNPACEEDFLIMGAANGAFTKPGAKQTLVFYQFCQTGNGLGNNGLSLIESGKVIGNYIAESGWALNLKSVPDVNRNGLDEFAVYYSGGMHQGQGGTGVDLMEFSAANIKGLGWFQVYSFTEDDAFSYKVSVKPGKIPIFYREKYDSVGEDKWKKSGKTVLFKLEKTYGKFVALK